MVSKGSVAVEGISLTIAEFDGEKFHRDSAVDLLADQPHTLAVGAPVNIEADVLVKLAKMQMRSNPGLKFETGGTREPEFAVTAEWLAANGY